MNCVTLVSADKEINLTFFFFLLLPNVFRAQKTPYAGCLKFKAKCNPSHTVCSTHHKIDAALWI